MLYFLKCSVFVILFLIVVYAPPFLALPWKMASEFPTSEEKLSMLYARFFIALVFREIVAFIIQWILLTLLCNFFNSFFIKG